MSHPHEKVISEMNISPLISILEESKLTYVRENLSIHLHESQIKLLKQVKKHQKPHHRKIRIKQYNDLKEKSDLFILHEMLYLDKYKKLENKELINIDEKPDNGLAYECFLTGKGQEVLTEICYLEHKWEDEIGVSDDDVDVLKNLAIKSFNIAYNHKKKLDFIF